MYAHRPDLLSLALGVAFLVLGIIFLANPQGVDGLDIPLVLGMLGIAAGVGIAGSLATGDVHRRAARRLAEQHDRWVSAAPPTPPTDGQAFGVSDEDLFGPPIDPEALDRAYRETFGDDDRL